MFYETFSSSSYDNLGQVLGKSVRVAAPQENGAVLPFSWESEALLAVSKPRTQELNTRDTADESNHAPSTCQNRGCISRRPVYESSSPYIPSRLERPAPRRIPIHNVTQYQRDAVDSYGGRPRLITVIKVAKGIV